MKLSIDDVTSVKLLKKSDASRVFQVLVNDNPYILKVYYTPVKQEWDPDYIETDPFLYKSAAYTRFKERGLCETQIVPNFLGSITQIDPNHQTWAPHLTRFLRDELPPQRHPHRIHPQPATPRSHDLHGRLRCGLSGNHTKDPRCACLPR